MYTIFFCYVVGVYIWSGYQIVQIHNVITRVQCVWSSCAQRWQQRYKATTFNICVLFGQGHRKKFKISNTIHWLNLWLKSISNPYWFVVWRKLYCWYVLLRWNVFSRIMWWSSAIIHIHLQVKQHFHLAYIKIRWYLAHLFQNMMGKCNSYWILYNSCCFDIGCLLSLLRFLWSAF